MVCHTISGTFCEETNGKCTRCLYMSQVSADAKGVEVGLYSDRERFTSESESI